MIRTLSSPACVALVLGALACGESAEDPTAPPGLVLEPVQSELFSAPGAQPNAWADYDNDGDLDLFVGFRGAPDRLYRNDDGVFRNVAPELGLDSPEETRAAAWGDIDADGHLDLYIGFPASAQTPNRLFRNEGNGLAFTDVAPSLGVDLMGTTRQPSFIDYDGDGDVDLFIAFRDKPNRLFRNDGDGLTDVTDATGIGDPLRTVGVAWFDMDQDGDLDAFVANQNGDLDAFYRNDRGRFTDVATELGMDGSPRSEEYGGVGPSVMDYDNDGDLDLFVANYGPDFLYRNNGDGTFDNVAPDLGLDADRHATTSAWGDFDNDGWPDLLVASYMANVPEEPDHLYRNEGGSFVDVTPEAILQAGASHGLQWADFDADGRLDLAVANNNAEGTHRLYRNATPIGPHRSSIQVMVVDYDGRYRLAGAEIRVFLAGTRRLLGTRLLDTGGGYCSQSVKPVHVGVPAGTLLDVEVTVLTSRGRDITRVPDVLPVEIPGGVLEIRVEPSSPVDRSDNAPR